MTQRTNHPSSVEWASHTHEKHTLDQKVDHLLHGIKLVLERENDIMADLTNLSAALDTLGVDLGTLATDQQAAFDALNAEIAALTVGSITQAQIDALTNKAEAAEASVGALDTAAKGATPPPTA